MKLRTFAAVAAIFVSMTTGHVRAEIDPNTAITVGLSLYQAYQKIRGSQQGDPTKEALDAMKGTLDALLAGQKRAEEVGNATLQNTNLIIGQLNAMTATLAGIQGSIDKAVIDINKATVQAFSNHDLANAEGQIDQYMGEIRIYDASGKTKNDKARLTKASERALRKITDVMGAYGRSLDGNHEISPCAAHFARATSIMFVHVGLAKSASGDVRSVKEIYEKYLAHCKRGDRLGTVAAMAYLYEAKLHYYEQALFRGIAGIPKEMVGADLDMKMLLPVEKGLRETILERVPVVVAQNDLQERLRAFGQYTDLRRQTEAFRIVERSVERLEKWLEGA